MLNFNAWISVAVHFNYGNYAWAEDTRACACVCVFEERSHLLEQDFVLLVSSSSFHLMIQFGDDLILELQLNTAAVNNQCG